MTTNGDVFNEVAYAYHDVRPNYPKGIIDAFVTFGDIPIGGRVLELGSGTGIATRQLAQQELEVTAVEPGSALMGIARTELERFPNVGFVQGRFLDVADSLGTYDAAVAATSWKWLGDRPAVEEKVHGLLSDDGHLGIIQNTTAVSDENGDAFYQASRPIYANYLDADPHAVPPTPAELKPDSLDRDLFRLAFFGFQVRYDRFTADQYLDLIGTYGDIIAMEPSARTALQADLGHLIVTQFDGVATMAHATTLTVAQKVT